MRSHAKVSVVVVAVLAFFAVTPSALADYLHRASFSGPADLEAPRRAVVEQATGNLFVVDSAHDRVLAFKPEGFSGSVLTELGTGVLDNPYGIAIEESGGETAVYVSDAGNNRIVRFLSDEAATPTFTLDAGYTSPAQGTEADQIQSFESTLALAPDGDLWVADSGANVVKRFDPSGAHVAGSNFDGSTRPGGAFLELLDVAVNSGGDLYVLETNGDTSQGANGFVHRFSADGAYQATLDLPEDRPGAVSVNPADDSVVVSDHQNNVYLDAWPTLHFFDSSNALMQDATISVAQYETVRGLAFRDAANDLLYVINDVGIWNGGPFGTTGIETYESATLPVPTVDPVDPGAVTATGATVTGSVDPEGEPAEWRLEYKVAGALAWQKLPLRGPVAGEDPVPVEANLDGLKAGTEYVVRLAATSVNGSKTSAETSFTTLTAAPTIVSVSATPGTETATLRARLNPGGEATAYYFEYGPTAGYGQTTAEQTTGNANSVIVASVEVGGLQPGATYHYRVVVENSVGGTESGDATFATLASADACANAELRAQTGSAHLTDCRAYELVTPPGSNARIRLVGGDSTPDGDVVCFSSEDTLAGSDPDGVKTTDQGFCAWRRADGWETKWVTGPAPAPGKRVASMGANVYWISPDGKRVVYANDGLAATPGFLEYLNPTGSPSMGPGPSAFMWEAGQYRWLAPSSPPVGDPPQYIPEGAFDRNSSDGGGSATYRRPVAVSDDLTHGLFESDLPILPADENQKTDVYEWYPGGIRIVSRDASGKAVGGLIPLQRFEQFIAYPGTISADGGRIFFEHEGDLAGGAPTDAYSVYMREGDDVTLVSPRGGSGPDEDVEFVGASADGDVVYLESTQQLTPEPKASGKAIYRYDVSAEEMELAAAADGGVKLLRSSRNAATFVYYELETSELVVQRQGVDYRLGSLSETDINAETGVATYRGFTRQHLRITPDGEVVVFGSRSGFAGTPAGRAQIYRWSAEDGLERVSFRNDGAPPSASASIGAYPGNEFGNPREELLSNHREKANVGRVVSDDGSRITFETTEALVGRDVNGASDVYQWHDGEVSLISTGTGSGSFYHESTPDGRTVFFTTYDRLIPALDQNNNRDLYVARPGGGFPLSATPVCKGEACQAATPPPAASGVGSGVIGDGNVLRGPAIAALGKKQLAQLASKGRATIRVTVATPGKVTAVLRGKVNGRRATVARASKQAPGAGTVALTLKLSAPARAELRDEGKLRLTLEVKQRRSEGVARKEVMLRG